LARVSIHEGRISALESQLGGLEVLIIFPLKANTNINSSNIEHKIFVLEVDCNCK